MSAVISYIIIPLIINATADLLSSLLLPYQKARTKAIRARCLLALGVTILLLTTVHTLTILFFSAGATPLPATAVTAVSLCITAALIIPKTDTFQAVRPRLCRFLRQVGIIAAAVLLIETFAFHTNSFTATYSHVSLPLDTAVLNDKATLTPEGITITNGADVEFIDDVNGVNVIEVRFTPCEQPVTVVVYAKDDNFSQKYIRVAERIIPTDDGYVHLPINTYGALHALKLTVTDTRGEEFLLTGVDLCNAVPFAFSDLRFFAMLAIGIGLAAVVTGRLYRLNYDRKRLSHKFAVVLAFLLCFSMHAALFVPYYLPQDAEELEKYENGDTVRDIGYPLESASNKEPYTQLLDAFYKHQLYIDHEPTEALMALDNPYDDSQRSTSDTPVHYLWDRAYYDGHYYCYFGITPMIFVWPYFHFTGAIPRTGLMCGVFAMAAVSFLFLLLMRLVNMYARKSNLLLLLGGLVAATGVTGLWWQHIMGSDYALPKISGMCFLFATLWLGLLAYDSKKLPVKLIAFALCAVGAVLTVGSRPTMILGALLLAPAFIHTLLRRDDTWKRKVMYVTAFFVPLAAGAAALMWYNAARFDSPFEFGANYQLTVSDIHASTVTLSLLPAAIYHYFLQPMSVDASFPFLRPSYSVMANYGRYMYIENCLGAINFPLLWTSALGLPALARRSLKAEPVKYAMYLSAPVLALAAAFLATCKGGIHIGYTPDFLPILAVVALPVFLELYARLQKRLSHQHFAVFLLILAATIFAVTCAGLYLARGSALVKEFYPFLLWKLDQQLLFWR